MTKDPKKFSTIITEAMEKEGVTISQLAQETGISENFIKFLVEGRIEELPSRPYTHGYVLKICKVLNMDGEKMWNKFFDDSENLEVSGRKDKLPQNRFAVSNLNKKAVFIGVLILALIGYFVFRAFAGANISDEFKVFNLKQDTTTVVKKSKYTLKGKVNPEYKLTVNNSPVYPEEGGGFQKTIQLEPGLNAVRFNIHGFLGREATKEKKIFFKATSTDTENVSTKEDKTKGTTSTLNSNNFINSQNGSR
ncbi:MAG: helix-turn-helix domain-containing protein [Candidatus Magasanikbacteria bacterium]